MTTGYIGSPTGNVIVPISNFTQRTKEIPLTIGTVTSVPATPGWTTIRAVGIFYADSAGVWRLRFNIVGTMTSQSYTIVNIPITGITSKNVAGANQTIMGAWSGNGNNQGGVIIPNSNTFTLNQTASASAGLTCYGDIELDSNPTAYTTAANLEGNVNVSAYFPNYSFGTAGIVPSAGIPINSYVHANRITSPQTYFGSTLNVVLFNNVLADRNSEYVSGTGIFTAKNAGLYDIRYCVKSTNGATPPPSIRTSIYYNAATEYAVSQGNADATLNFSRTYSNSAILPLAINDTVSIVCVPTTQNTTGDYGAGYTTELYIARIGS